jgi:hypothetical protein
VDWYAQGAGSIHTLMMDQMVSHAPKTLIAAPAAADELPTAAANNGASFEGVWMWREIGGQNPAAGALILTEPKGGHLKGLSLVEAPLNPEFGKRVRAARVLIAAPLKGRRDVDQTGKKYMEFTVANGSAGATTTRAEFSADGKTLEGSSTLGLTNDKGQKAKHSYRWVATRL